MPTAELCRMVLGRTRHLRVLAGGRAVVVPVPFGMSGVLQRLKEGEQGGHLAGSGFACDARTALALQGLLP